MNDLALALMVIPRIPSEPSPCKLEMKSQKPGQASEPQMNQ